MNEQDFGGMVFSFAFGREIRKLFFFLNGGPGDGHGALPVLVEGRRHEGGDVAVALRGLLGDGVQHGLHVALRHTTRGASTQPRGVFPSACREGHSPSACSSTLWNLALVREPATVHPRSLS